MSKLDEIKNFPAELKQEKRWVCYRLPSKIPLCAIGNANAKSNDPSTFADYETALHRATKQGDMDGIGYVLNDGMIGVDLDDVMDDDGAMLPWAQTLIRNMNTYAELSPSGKGVHMYVRGQIPQHWRKQVVVDGGGSLECYRSGRYFTVTGKVLAGTREIGTLTDVGLEALAAYIKQEPRAEVEHKTETTPRPASTGETAYALETLKRECAELAATAEGQGKWVGRNSALNNAAMRAGGFVASGELSEQRAIDELRHAALASGLDEVEVEKTLRSGFVAGLRNPAYTPPSNRTAPAPRQKPVVIQVNHATLMDRAWESLQYTQGMTVAGIACPAYEFLTDALFGFRGITLLTGPTGCGKTTLTLSVALSVADGAKIDCETCEPLPKNERAQVVYVTTEMDPNALVVRMIASMARVSIRSLMTELHTLTKKQTDDIETARAKLKHLLGNTLHIITPQNVDMSWGAEGVDHALHGLQSKVDEVTGGARALVIIDTLACMTIEPMEGTKAHQSELDTDRDMTHGLRRWRSHLGYTHSAILAVHEESKARTGSGDAHASRGSSRYAYGADALLAMMYADADDGTRTRGLRDSAEVDGRTDVDMMVNKARDGGKGGSTIGLIHDWGNAGVVKEYCMWSASQRASEECSDKAKAYRAAQVKANK